MSSASIAQVPVFLGRFAVEPPTPAAKAGSDHAFPDDLLPEGMLADIGS